MDWSVEQARAEGAGALLLTVWEENARAKRFYEKLGYSVFGTLEDYPAGHSRYFLRKTLGEPGR